MTDKDDTNEDKKEIEDEEREKMLNEENKKEQITDLDTIKEDVKDKIEDIESETEKEVEVVKTGEVEKMKKQLEESEKEGRGRVRVPIGGIKIPGFLRSRSKDKTKENDTTGEEGTDLLEPQCVAEHVGGTKDDTKEGAKGTKERDSFSSMLQKIKIPLKNPFAAKSSSGQPEKLENQDEAAGDPPKRQSIIDSIKIPLVSVLPKTFTRGSKDKPQQDKDVEAGNAAGLASMETLEDSKGSLTTPEDGLETVKLDGDDKTDTKDPEKEELTGEEPVWRILLMRWKERILAMSKHEKAVAGVVIFLLLLILIIIIAASGPSPPRSPPVIDGKYITTQTSCGNVEGLLEDGAFVFRGIPYAVPPVGPKRWHPAQPLNDLSLCWSDTLKAHNSTSSCWHLYYNGSIDGNEDCLTLDIWTPAVRYDTPVAVVVLIDAATMTGGAPGTLFPTSKLVRAKEVVFVRPNFRLGVLGFLAAQPLSSSVYPPSSGNYGLSDILTALLWVQHNIVHFGGDKSLVTVLGHRAGATLVTELAYSDQSKGLFARAWASSGSVIYPELDLRANEQYSERYVETLCQDSSLACLMNKDAEELLDSLEDHSRPQPVDLPTPREANGTKKPWLVVDGKIIKTTPWKGESLQVPLVVGTTAHSEASPQLWEKTQRNGPQDEAISKHIRQSVLGNMGLAEEALRLYNRTWEGLAALVSDIRTVCPLLTFAKSQENNVSFYVVTLERNHTDFGEIADVDADMSSILGRYEPRTTTQRRYVTAIQQVFYHYVNTGEMKSGRGDGFLDVLNINQDANWQVGYKHCNFWISKNVVLTYARRD